VFPPNNAGSAPQTRYPTEADNADRMNYIS
jgi:hypothetical protein